MKYFTHAWAYGDMDDEAFDRVLQHYNEHLARNFEQDAALWRFANTVGLNDAYVDRIIVRPATREIRLLLLTGDLQVGYWRTELLYSHAEIVEGAVALRRALAARPTEILYDEFVREPDRPSHAFLLDLNQPNEFRISFETFDYAQTPTPARLLATKRDQSEW